MIGGLEKRTLRSRPTVHRHMALTVGGDWRTVPPRPPFATLETSQLGHEVELTGPGISHEMQVQSRTAFADYDALELDCLEDGIMNRDFEPCRVHPGP